MASWSATSRFNLPFTGTAPVKPPVGIQSGRHAASRATTSPDKVSGKYVYMQHVRVPGMLHGRVVRPRGQRAVWSRREDPERRRSFYPDIPGARVLRKGDFLGVVAENEWDAVRAAQQLKVDWDNAARASGQRRALRTHARGENRRAASCSSAAMSPRGFSGAAHIVSHDLPRALSVARALRTELRDRRREGRFGAGDVLHAGCLRHAQQLWRGCWACLSKKFACSITKARALTAIAAMTMSRRRLRCFRSSPGKPVRLQFMRWDEHGWDNYGPAHVGEVRAAADADGKIVAYEYHGWQHNWSGTETSAQLAGAPAAEWPGAAQGVQGVNPLNLRRHVRYSQSAAGESQAAGHGVSQRRLAALAAGSFVRVRFRAGDRSAGLSQLAMDPYEFRQRNIDRSALAGRSGRGRARPRTGRLARRRPICRRPKSSPGGASGVGTHLTRMAAPSPRSKSTRRPAACVAKHLYGAIDAGLVVNPGFVESQIMRAVGADRQPHVQGGSHVQHRPASPVSTGPAIRSCGSTNARRLRRGGAAARSEIHRRGRRSDGGRRGGDRQRVLRRDRRADARISSDAGPRAGRAREPRKPPEIIEVCCRRAR